MNGVQWLWIQRFISKKMPIIGSALGQRKKKDKLALYFQFHLTKDRPYQEKEICLCLI